MPAGRPTDYGAVIADRIVEALEEFNLYRLCRDFDDLPARSTILQWMETNPEFATRCARADKMRGCKWSAKIEELADSCDEGNAQSSKVKISAYQWLASKGL